MRIIRMLVISRYSVAQKMKITSRYREQHRNTNIEESIANVLYPCHRYPRRAIMFLSIEREPIRGADITLTRVMSASRELHVDRTMQRFVGVTPAQFNFRFTFPTEPFWRYTHSSVIYSCPFGKALHVIRLRTFVLITLQK